MAVLLVAHVHALILVTFRVSKVICLLFLPLAMAVLQAVLELPSVAAAVFPLVLTEALRLSLVVLTDIAISIHKKVRAIALT